MQGRFKLRVLELLVHPAGEKNNKSVFFEKIRNRVELFHILLPIATKDYFSFVDLQISV